jgi:hypothetical protein
VAIANGSAHAIVVDDSASTAFIGLKLLASPGMGILENAGPGGTVLQNVSIVPGPRPAGAGAGHLAIDGARTSWLRCRRILHYRQTSMRAFW